MMNNERTKAITIAIAKNLRNIRKMRKISQSEAARKIGVTYQQVQKYENGTNRISATYLYIAKHLYNVEYEDFFKGVE